MSVTRSVRALARDEALRTLGDVACWSGFEDPALLVATWPQVYGARPLAVRIGLFDGDELLSHAAARTVELVTGDGPRRAMLIGSVATAPQRRGEGLASALLDELAAIGRDEGCDLLLLWSDRWEFYARLGYAPAGAQQELRVAAGTQPLPGLRRARPSDAVALHALHERKPLRVRRSLTEMAVLLSAGRMQTFVHERDGVVDAYACLGKGGDLAGWWHELGGADAVLAELLPAAMRELGRNGATVILPPYRRELLALLPAITSAHSGVVALAARVTGGPVASFFVDGLDSL